MEFSCAALFTLGAEIFPTFMAGRATGAGAISGLAGSTAARTGAGCASGGSTGVFLAGITVAGTSREFTELVLGEAPTIGTSDFEATGTGAGVAAGGATGAGEGAALGFENCAATVVPPLSRRSKTAPATAPTTSRTTAAIANKMIVDVFFFCGNEASNGCRRGVRIGATG